MVNDTRSTRRSKDDEITSSTKKAIKSKGSSTSGSPTADTSGLRRSTRGTPSRKQISSSPSTTRKSERLEKRTPTKIPVKRKNEIVEKQKVSIPLRRSDRGKKHLLPSSSGSRKSEKGSDSSDIERKKLKREKS
ncbi:ATP-dependent helicase family protein [Actinidia rufa]|uniref:ATP-dependent helicase family protein n=1 Tax=Actinidia rufa TaxID=165716 RepID=A0A7J0HBS1_9ERIC|nr:ATP-dependent helicase family protein [Actinidia rufa]